MFFVFQGLLLLAQDNNDLFREITLPIDSEEEYLSVTEFRDEVTFADNNKIGEEYAVYIPYFNSALNFAQSNKTQKETYNIKIDLLNLYARVDNINEVISIGSELINQKSKLNVDQLRIVVGTLNFYYRTHELHEEAFELIPIMEEVQLKTPQGKYREEGYSQYLDIGLVYYRMKEFPSAIKYFKLQAAQYENVGNKLMVSSMNNNIGLCFFNMKKYDGARLFFEKALNELSLPDSNGLNSTKPAGYRDFFRTVIEANIADIEVKEKNYAAAIEAYENEIESQENVGRPTILTDALIKLSEVQFLVQNTSEASKTINQAENSLQDFDKPEAFIDLYQLKGKILLTQNHLDSANTYFLKAQNIIDSIEVVRLKRNSKVAAAKFDYTQQINKLKETQAQLKTSEEKRRLQRIALIVSLAFVVILGFVIVRYRAKRR